MIIDGQKLARQREVELKARLKKLESRPKLVSLVFADDQAGRLYTRLKAEAAKRVGVEFLARIVREADFEKAIVEVRRASQDLTVDGVMIQYPGLSWARKHGWKGKELQQRWKQLTVEIDKKKDVDGLRADSKFRLAAVRAVEFLIDDFLVRPVGNYVVVGAKGFVGARLVKRLKEIGCRVEAVDVGDDLLDCCRSADVLISATGKRNLITAEMVKQGALVIDVGWPKGDVDFDSVETKVGWITPVPGGVGPLTVVFLLENLVDSLYNRKTTHTGQPS